MLVPACVLVFPRFRFLRCAFAVLRAIRVRDSWLLIIVGLAEVSHTHTHTHTHTHMLATNRDGFILSSFAIDSFGGLGAEARKVVSMLSDYATQHSLDGLSSRQHKSDLRREISVSLHKHNARMTQRWLCNERRRGIHRQATSSAFAASAASSLGLAAHH